jgi:hypothetical protein
MPDDDHNSANDNLAEPLEHRHLPEHREIYEIMERAKVHKALADTQLSAGSAGATPIDASLKRQRDLDVHDRLMAQGAAKASRDALHDSGSGKEPGAYTTHEARDRAAHTPPHAQNPRPGILTRCQTTKSRSFTEAERELLRENERDLAELYPTPQAWERSYPKLYPPADPEQRAQYDDLAEIASREKGAINVTPKQKENVDRMLADTQLSDKIGGASDVTGKPTPNDPMPVEKALEIGQDLHKAVVTMDKDDK